MGKLFKYLKKHAGIALVIVCVLFIQAFCDLSLPSYTSDIVNIGIQQNGIDTSVPEQIAKEDLEKLLLLIPQEDTEKVTDAYREGTESDLKTEKDFFVLKDSVKNSEEKIENLTDIMGRPMLLAEGFDQDSKEIEVMKEQITAQLPQGMFPEDADMFDILAVMPQEQREAMVSEMEKQMDNVPDTMLDQAAVLYVKSAYQNLGMDMNRIQTNYILVTGGKMLALAFLGLLASVTVGLLASRTAAAVGRDLRRDVFTKVVGFSSGEFDKFSTASLITRSTNDIQQIQMVMVMMLRMVLYAPIIAIGGIYKVVHTNVSMTWIIGLAVVLIFVIVMILFACAMPKFRILQKLVDRLNLVTREILTGLSVIRAFSTEQYEEKRFDVANRDLTKTNLFVNRAMTFMMPGMMLVMNGVSVLIVWTGAHGIDTGEMQVGDMMAFIQYTMQIIMAFLMICMISIMLPRAAVAADRVDEVITSDTAIHDPKKPEHFDRTGKGVVEFDHVSFRYPGAGKDVLHDIHFTAEPGKTTAIIGSTGSGKSTLVNLIPRFYDVTEGQIRIDGMDIRQVSQHELRDKLGFVPQKGVLFSGTIASNIGYSNPDMSKERIQEAAQIAQAEAFIEEKPKQYDSPISQGGGNVSGGQKQRLSIARAIAKHPDIFIFDDSFSALDYKTDTVLRKALKEKTKDSTVIIVAQRISTILHAEQIIVLDEGEIAGIGTHEELLRTCDAYYQIASSQLSQAELEKAMKTGGKEEDAHE
ncbi:ABC transporter [Drancourtella sp. An210]|nr:ABC transporter [Drancourtella sp. An210]